MDRVKKITYTGIMTALVFLATFIIKIPIPFSTGYIHLGDCMVFLAALFLGFKYGAFAAGVGSMLADVFGGFFTWAIPTLIIKSAMAFFIGLALRNKNIKSNITYGAMTFVIWTTFVLGMKRLLTKGMQNVSKLAVQMETDVSGLERVANTSGFVMIASSIAVLIIVASIWFYIKKKQGDINIMFLLGTVAAGLWMTAGYYLTELILYGNAIVPIFSIPLNLLQFTVGLIIASIVYIPLRKNYTDIFID